MIADILIGLAKANVAAVIAVLCVITLRKWVRGRFGARAAYALWLAPLLAAGTVFLPHPALRTAAPESNAPFVLQAKTAADEFVAQMPGATATHPDFLAVLLAAWIAGGLGTAGLLARQQARFMASLGRLSPTAERGVYRAERAGVGPAVVGVFRPKVIAPADFEARFGAGERTLILAHERAHLVARDALVNAASCTLQSACWFNPLIHLATRLMHIDQEMACDAAVVGRFPAERRAYAELLLKTQLSSQPLPLGCHWPAGAEHPLKERIAMLKSPLPSRSARTLGTSLALCACACAAGIAWAASPAGVSDHRDVIGAAERLEAQANAAKYPEYTCDPVIEAKGVGCKIIRVPTWLALPTHDDLIRHYPPAALKAGLIAKVTINCAITQTGLYKDCEVQESEVRAPDGASVSAETRAAFGEAAVTLSRYYQRWLIDTKTRPWNVHATMPIFFSPSGTPTPGPPISGEGA